MFPEKPVAAITLILTLQNLEILLQNRFLLALLFAALLDKLASKLQVLLND